MFCSICGTKNADGKKFCSNCGAILTKPDDQFNLYATDAPGKSKEIETIHPVTIVAIVLAVVSLFMNILNGGMYIALGGVICSIIGLCMPGKKNKRLAIAALIISGLAFGYLYSRWQKIASLFS